MKRYYVEDADEIGTLYIGAAREMKRVLDACKTESEDNG